MTALGAIGLPAERFATLALAGALAVGCGGGDGSQSDGQRRGADDLVVLSIELPTCGRFENCWRSMGIEAPGALVLEDAAGAQRFTLRDPEYDAVIEVALLRQFQEAMSEPQTWDCPERGEKESTLRIEWKDGRVQSALVVDGCFGSTDEPLGIYDALLLRLVELKNKYLACPPAFSLPPDIDPVTDPPPIRPLCFACFGHC
jgi:hypothetical protein